jgi:superfamily I DNA/RNA helicase
MTSIFDVLDFKKLVKSFETTNFKNDPNIMDSIRPWLIHPDHSRMNYKELPLDSRQRGIVFSKNEKLHRKIKGPAGSGKSLVLCAKANYLSNSKTVLILTFNITIFSYLIDFVQRKIKNNDNEYFTPKMINITAMHFHGFWKEFCHMHGQEKEYFNNPLQSNIAVEKVIKNLDKYGDKYKKYDAILVDEAQDMQDSSWWNLFRKYFLNDGGEMLLIADSSQDIYGINKLDDLSLSGCGLSPNWIRLEGNHRLPKAFIPYLKSFKELFSIDTDLPYISEKESSDELLLNLRWVQVTKAALEKFDENITEIILNEFNIMGERFANNSYSDVYILGTLKQELNKIEKAFTGMKIEAISTYSSNKKKERLKKIFFSKNSAKVKITTIHSMKGLESKNLILFIDYNSRTRNDTSLKLIYTGLSRLKKSDSGSYLTVICTHPRFKKYGEKWPSYDSVNLQ